MLYAKNPQFLLSMLILFGLFFSACQKEEIAPVPEIRTFSNVDERLWTYFERFEEESKARGLNIDLNAIDITGIIEDIDGEHIAGQCTTFGNFRPREITIDTEFWNIASNLYREYIIFHELGHCVLNRGHREDAHANGTCVSIMRSGTLDCRDNYNLLTREAYMNELFDPNQLNSRN